VKKENWAYLAGGTLLGALIGYGVYDFAGRPASSVSHESEASAAPAEEAPLPAGALAPSAGPSLEEIANLERRVQAEPKNAEALKHLGNLMYDAARWTEALGYYRRALDAGPQDANVLTDAGICYRQLRRPEEALELFRRAQEADPGHWQSLFNAAVVAGFDLRRFDAADEAVRKLEKINPGAPGLERLRQDLARTRAGPGAAS
jgi:tetratricopeptide (TPR) repeat protein